jgi:UDP-N-acetyl-D-glucosamine dehydrogenase
MSSGMPAKQPKPGHYHALAESIEKKQARVAVVGLGYVGLPLALTFAESGFHVLGLDIDPQKPAKLERGESYIRHIESARIAAVRQGERFTASSDFRRFRQTDVGLICVPTPLGEHQEPDLSFVISTGRSLRDNLRAGHLVVLESTTYPGTTEEVLLPILEESGLRCLRQKEGAEDSDFFLAFSPEREDPGNPKVDSRHVPKVVGGVNAPSLDLTCRLYRQAFKQVVPVSSTSVAEMAKLLENIYRAVNIALVNELKLLCLRMGIDIWEVIEAASTKPFGFTPFYPGPGLGGHCIPIDPFYLSWKAKEHSFTTRFIELAGEINTAMPYHVVEAVAGALDKRGKTLNDSRILVLGVAYKKDVEDVRESPALKIMELLGQRGARVSFHDPYVPRMHKMRHYHFALESVPLTAETLRAHDCALVVTDHSDVDYELVARECPLVVDSRNATRHVRNYRDKIVAC